MSIYNGIYRFTNAKYSNKALNVYGTNSAKNMRNVCIFRDTPSDPMQKWNIKKVGEYYRMRSFVEPAYALDRSTARSSKNNAQLYESRHSDDADQLVEIFKHRGHYKIKLASYDLYLTAANDDTPVASKITKATLATANSNVYWAAPIGSSKQKWDLEKVDGGSTPTGKEVIVTGMPKSKYYPNRKEYFHPTSGMVAGTFYGTNKGQTAILDKIAAFYEKVFGIAPSGVDKYAYSLYGSKTISTDPKFNGTYHLGVDMTYMDGANIKSAHSGIVTVANDVVVGIYNSATNKTYYYVHMERDDKIKVGVEVHIRDILGTQHNNGTKDPHLHFQVGKGRCKSCPYPSKSLSNPLQAVNPYKYM